MTRTVTTLNLRPILKLNESAREASLNTQVWLFPKTFLSNCPRDCAEGSFDKVTVNLRAFLIN